jgi:hypothetical protein
MNLETMFAERRRAENAALRDSHNAKVRISNMALCSATDPEAPIESRLAAAKQALDVWKGNSIMTEVVEKQIPHLVDILRSREHA